jgi:tight adherence protein B
MILIVSFVGILLLSLVIISVAMRTPATEKVVQKRLRSIEAAKRSIDADVDAIELSQDVKTGLLYRLGEHLERYHFAANLQKLILHSGSKSTVGAFAATSVGLAVGMGFLAHTFIGLPPIVIVATIIGGVARYALLRFQKTKRLKAFNIALPDAIELMARALRAGHSMSSSIEIIAEQSVEPLAAEFADVYQQQKFGIPFRDALLEMGTRIPSKDLHFLITAILVQKETGGDLTEILDRTTHVIRERVRIEGEIRTYTAQGRLTGWILSLLPVIMLVVINIISPGYSHILFHDPVGQKMLYAGGALIILGAFIISKIVDIQV